MSAYRGVCAERIEAKTTTLLTCEVKSEMTRNEGHMFGWTNIRDTLEEAATETKRCAETAKGIIDEMEEIPAEVKETVTNMRKTSTNWTQFIDQQTKLLSRDGNKWRHTLTDTLNQVAEIPVSVRTHIDSLMERLKEDTSRGVSEVVTGVIGVTEEVRLGAKGISRLMGQRLLLVMECFTLYFTRYYLPKWIWYCLFAQAVIRWFGLGKYIEIFMEYFWKATGTLKSFLWEDTEGEPSAQLLERNRNDAHSIEDIDFSKIITVGIFTTLCVAIGKASPNKSYMEAALRSCNGVFSLKKGLDSIPGVFEAIEKIVREVAVWAVGDEKTNNRFREMDMIFDDYKDWCEEVSALYTEEGRREATLVRETRERILVLRARGNAYMRKFQGKDWPISFRTTFNQVWKMITELGVIAEQSKHFELFRMDPFCVAVYGEPGVGKSVLCTSIGLMLTKAMGLPLENAIYSRGQSDHWDNYHNHPIVYYDDFAQGKGEQANEQMREFVALKSNNPYILKKADIKEKGQAFSSRAIVMSTNFPYPDVSNYVYMKEAVYRRREMLIEVRLKSAAKSGDQPNREAIKRMHEREEFSHMAMRLMDPMNNELPGRWIPWDEMKQIIMTQFARHETQQEELKYKTDAQIYDMNYLNGLRRMNDGHMNEEEPECSAWKHERPPFRPMAVNIAQLPMDDEIEIPIEAVAGTGLETEDERRGPNGGYLMSRGELYGYVVHYVQDNILTPHETLGWLLTEEVLEQSMGAFVRYGASMYSMISSGILTYLKGKVRPSDGAYSEFQRLRPHLMRQAHEAQDIMMEELGVTIVRNGLGDIGNKVRTWRDNIKGFIRENELLKKIKDNAKTLVVITTGVVAAVGLWNYLGRMPEMESNIPHHTTSGDPRTPRFRKTNTVSRAVRRVNDMNDGHSAGLDQGASDLINHKLKKHLYKVTVRGKSTNGLATSGQHLIVPWHLVRHVEEGDLFTIEGCNCDPIYFNVKKSQIRRIGREDLAYILNIKRMSMAPDLIKYMLKESDLAMATRTDVVLLTKSLVADDYEIRFGVAECLDETVEHDVEGRTESDVFAVRTGWRHTVKTTNGMCISPLISTNRRYPRRLIGLHISGGVHGSVALCPTQELMTSVLERGERMDTNDAHMATYIDEWDVTDVSSGYRAIGVVKKEFADYNPTKSDIIPTIIHDKIREHVTEPAILTVRDPRNTKGIDPFENAMSKYCVRTLPLPVKSRELAEEWLIADVIDSFTPSMDVRVMTEDLAINATTWSEGYEPLKMDTSPGWPYKLRNPLGKKRYFDFDAETLQWKMKPSLRKIVKDNVMMLKNGKLPCWIWPHCLKDERRPLEKVRSVKTRIFTMAPLDLTIVVRMLTMHFTAAMYRASGKSFSSVGINPHGVGWTHVAQNMLRAGECHGDADYGRYDGTLDADLISSAMKSIGEWYWKKMKEGSHIEIRFDDGDVVEFDKDGYQRALQLLASEFVHTKQLLRRTLHQKVQGNPSGNALTVVLNTLVGYQYLAIAFIQLARTEKVIPRYAKWKEEVWINVYGDDFTISTRPSIWMWFNTSEIAKFMAQFGIELTPASKTGEHELKSIEEVQFLKRKWKRHPEFPDRFTAPIAKDTIYEMLNWMRKNDDPDKQLREQIDEALREAAAYDSGFYDTLLGQIRQSEAPGSFPNEFGVLDCCWLGQFE